MTADWWYDSPASVLHLGHWLVETGAIRDLKDLLYYFEKPWKYTQEYDQMVLVETAGDNR